MSKKRPQTSVWIDCVGDDINVFDARGDLLGIYSKDALVAEATAKNWHLIPLAVVRAVSEFEAGGWGATRPPHCSR